MVTSKATTVRAYLASLPKAQRDVVQAVRDVIIANLPDGFEEHMQYGMIGYNVPLARFPDTYNEQPLGLAALAAQKNYFSLYLLGIYGREEFERWFEAGFRRAGKRLDKGKSCVRFRSLEDLPLPLIGEAIARLSVDDVIAMHEASHAAKRTAASRAPAKRKATKRTTTKRKASSAA